MKNSLTKTHQNTPFTTIFDHFSPFDFTTFLVFLIPFSVIAPSKNRTFLVMDFLTPPPKFFFEKMKRGGHFVFQGFLSFFKDFDRCCRG